MFPGPDSLSQSACGDMALSEPGSGDMKVCCEKSNRLLCQWDSILCMQFRLCLCSQLVTFSSTDE